jgi:hypothetical protein
MSDGKDSVIVTSESRWREAVPRVMAEDLEERIELGRSVNKLQFPGSDKRTPLTEDEIVRNAALALVNERDDIIDRLTKQLVKQTGHRLTLTGGAPEVVVIPDGHAVPFTIKVIGTLGVSTFRVEAERVEVQADAPKEDT